MGPGERQVKKFTLWSKNWPKQEWERQTHIPASASFSSPELPKWLARWVSCGAAYLSLQCRVKPGYSLTGYSYLVMVLKKQLDVEFGL